MFEFEGPEAEGGGGRSGVGGGGGWGEGRGWVGLGGRRPDPGLLAPDASRQEAEASFVNLMFPVFPHPTLVPGTNSPKTA